MSPNNWVIDQLRRVLFLYIMAMNGSQTKQALFHRVTQRFIRLITVDPLSRTACSRNLDGIQKRQGARFPQVRQIRVKTDLGVTECPDLLTILFHVRDDKDFLDRSVTLFANMRYGLTEVLGKSNLLRFINLLIAKE